MLFRLRKPHFFLWQNFVSVYIAITFVFSMVIPPEAVFAQSVLNLPAPGTVVPLTNGFAPLMIKGINLHAEDALKFDFIMDKGDTDYDDAALRAASTKLIKYFLASLTIPEDEMWVNLSPYEAGRIIPEHFGQTEMGRDMLVQDYMLKQIMSSIMSPQNEHGRAFWDRVHERARAEFGTEDVPLDTFTKVWIIADEAKIYEHEKGAFVVDSHMKVMLEADYLAMENNSVGTTGQPPGQTEPDVASDIIREILIPEIEKEVNQGATFANLRQIYNAMILASWYKKALKESIFAQVYVDQAKTAGVDTADKSINQKIYEQYVASFKKGVADYITEEYDPVTQQIVPKKYFTGGVAIKASQQAKVDDVNLAMLSQDRLVMVTGATEAVDNDAAMTADSSGTRLPYDTIAIEVVENAVAALIQYVTNFNKGPLFEKMSRQDLDKNIAVVKKSFGSIVQGEDTKLKIGMETKEINITEMMVGANALKAIDALRDGTSTDPKDAISFLTQYRQILKDKQAPRVSDEEIFYAGRLMPLDGQDVWMFEANAVSSTLQSLIGFVDQFLAKQVFEGESLDEFELNISRLKNMLQTRDYPAYCNLINGYFRVDQGFVTSGQKALDAIRGQRYQLAKNVLTPMLKRLERASQVARRQLQGDRAMVSKLPMRNMEFLLRDRIIEQLSRQGLPENYFSDIIAGRSEQLFLQATRLTNVYDDFFVRIDTETMTPYFFPPYADIADILFELKRNAAKPGMENVEAVDNLTDAIQQMLIRPGRPWGAQTGSIKTDLHAVLAESSRIVKQVTAMNDTERRARLELSYKMLRHAPRPTAEYARVIIYQLLFLGNPLDTRKDIELAKGRARRERMPVALFVEYLNGDLRQRLERYLEEINGWGEQRIKRMKQDLYDLIDPESMAAKQLMVMLFPNESANLSNFETRINLFGSQVSQWAAQVPDLQETVEAFKDKEILQEAVTDLYDRLSEIAGREILPKVDSAMVTQTARREASLSGDAVARLIRDIRALLREKKTAILSAEKRQQLEDAVGRLYYFVQAADNSVIKEDEKARLRTVFRIAFGLMIIEGKLKFMGGEGSPLDVEIGLVTLDSIEGDLERADQAMATQQSEAFNKGGIDFNPENLDIQVQKNGDGVIIPLAPPGLENMNIDGFIPVIIHVTPVTNLPNLIGMNPDDGDAVPQPSVLDAVLPEEQVLTEAS